MRICKNCRHKFGAHDCLTSNPVQWRCSGLSAGVACRCKKYEDLLEGKNEASGQLASLLCRLGMWCAQQRNRPFEASTDEVEAYLIELGKGQYDLHQALEDFLIVKLYDDGNISSRVKDLVKPHRGKFRKEIEFFVEKYRTLFAEHMLVS